MGANYNAATKLQQNLKNPAKAPSYNDFQIVGFCFDDRQESLFYGNCESLRAK